MTMTNVCRRCFSPLREGQLACVVVTATYHILKSSVAYALDKTDMNADPDTLVHGKPEECVYDLHAD